MGGCAFTNLFWRYFGWTIAPQFLIYLVMVRLCLEGRKIDCGSQYEFAEMVWADYAGRRDRVSDDVSLRKWLEEDPVKPQYIFFWNRFLEERSKITKVLLRALGEHGRRFSIVSRNKCYFWMFPHGFCLLWTGSRYVQTAWRMKRVCRLKHGADYNAEEISLRSLSRNLPWRTCCAAVS